MTSRPAEPVGTLATALAHAARLLPSNPDLAEAQSREILKVAPQHPDAVTLLAAALRRQGRSGAALEVLGPAAEARPDLAQLQFETALARMALGDGPAAIIALNRVVALAPDHAQAWRALGDQLTLADRHEEADAAYARHIKASTRDPRLIEAATALCDNRLAVAERLLRTFLKAHPTDVGAIRMLAEAGLRLGRYDDAEALLARALELAPSFAAARQNYATVLYRQNKAAQAIVQVDLLLADDPRNPGHRNLKAAALGRIGEYDAAIECYGGVLADYPGQPKVWMSYGHSLKTVGRQAEAVEAYRRSLAIEPGLGEAYWSLANLKTVKFTDADVAAMESQLQRLDLSDDDRFHLHFALGKALEDAERYEESFGHYDQGAALRRAGLDYDAEETSRHVARSKVAFTGEFFAERAGRGSPAPDPIFIVGLPRSGSTLIEQILASHSAVEGTQELPDIIAMARRLGGPDKAYPENLADLDAAQVRELGEEFLARTQVHRKLGRPFFIDKMPNNFAHAGLIALILPNARIIDARRHPLGCCFSGFKQHFARGQAFSYSLSDIGRYYADYVALMAHFDAILPGRIHRVIYEEMVADPEAQVRRLLDYCGLPFEDGCLRFYENDRAVRTASSEQVRRPIFADATDHWRNYEPWLGPLKAELGAVLEAYPAAPAP
ncbi:tetratricopeptide repeat-containing sulfotransferase family protein [Phenylobacterium sp.]|uniref:tetratricopeptide repeat-containing sulfotransferase family protein n=1 Tax=Phenylobacterium sp. TaxID=1871053 RepID=UPI0027356994|nr:tetratricopeptide repeat-containing sulfotransferase family protein [Phenylobacterium sp.]MDP3854410.1 sulfotransferase [Phenylobacterium sp.]